MPSTRLDGSGLVIVWIALLHNWRERFRAVASLEKDGLVMRTMMEGQEQGPKVSSLKSKDSKKKP